MQLQLGESLPEFELVALALTAVNPAAPPVDFATMLLGEIRLTAIVLVDAPGQGLFSVARIGSHRIANHLARTTCA
jgi:hypothetical protein